MIYINIVILVVVRPPESDPGEVAPEVAWSEPDGSTGSADGFLATCKKCGWSKAYPTPVRAKQALGGHSRFCQGVRWRVSPFSRPFRP
jgi:hypothetical protein